MKKCAKCGKRLPYEYFHRMKAKKDGFSIYCKKCLREKRVARWEKEKKSRLIYLKRNREAMTIYWWKRICHYHKLDYKKIMASYLAQGKRCYYCAISVDWKNLHIDHYYPQSKKKIVIACEDCNRLKWRRNGDEFKKFIPAYLKRFLPLKEE